MCNRPSILSSLPHACSARQGIVCMGMGACITINQQAATLSAGGTVFRFDNSASAVLSMLFGGMKGIVMKSLFRHWPYQLAAALIPIIYVAVNQLSTRKTYDGFGLLLLFAIFCGDFWQYRFF